MSPAQFFLEHPTLAYLTGALYLVGMGYVLGDTSDYEPEEPTSEWVVVVARATVMVFWPVVLVAMLWIAAGERVRK